MPSRADLVPISFEIDGEIQLDRALGLLKKNIQEVFTIVGPDIRDDFLTNQRTQFDTEGRHGSAGWASLSPAYAAWKAKNFPGRPLLVLKGDLRSSLTDKNHPNFVYRVTPFALTLGTTDPKARWHQKGTQDMPDRKPVELVESQKTRWPKLVQEGIFKSGQGFEQVLI